MYNDARMYSMPTPVELTALLLAGSISVGSYEHKMQCPDIPDMEKELLMSLLEAKYRDMESVQISDVIAKELATESSRVLLSSWRGKDYRIRYLRFTGLVLGDKINNGISPGPKEQNPHSSYRLAAFKKVQQ
jgi:hypothetical protein